MSLHGPLADVVDHCARTWSAPLEAADSVQVSDPEVNVEILATMSSASVPSLVITLDCGVSQLLSGSVPKANTLLLTVTLNTFPTWKSPTLDSAVIWVEVGVRVPIVGS